MKVIARMAKEARAGIPAIDHLFACHSALLLAFRATDHKGLDRYLPAQPMKPGCDVPPTEPYETRPLPVITEDKESSGRVYAKAFTQDCFVTPALPHKFKNNKLLY